MNSKERNLSTKEKKDCQDSQELWTKSIIEDMQWFPFQDIYLNIANNINSPAERLKLLLNILSMFKIRILHEDTIVAEDVTYAVGIICINCGKTIGFYFDKQTQAPNWINISTSFDE